MNKQETLQISKFVCELKRAGSMDRISSLCRASSSAPSRLRSPRLPWQAAQDTMTGFNDEVIRQVREYMRKKTKARPPVSYDDSLDNEGKGITEKPPEFPPESVEQKKK